MRWLGRLDGPALPGEIPLGRQPPAGLLAREILGRQARRDLRQRGIRDPRLDGYLDRMERRAAIGTPSASANITGADGTSRQSGTLNTSANDLLVACAAWENTNPSTITFSDLGSNTWHTLTKRFSAGPGCCLGWAVASGSTSNNRATVTFNASCDYVQIVFVRVTGCDTSSPFDQENGGTGNSAAPSAGSITTTAANEIIFVLVKTFSGGSFTNGSWLGGSGTELFDNADTVGVGYRIVSSTGTYTGSSAFSGSADWAAAMASFKAAGAGSITGDLAATLPAWTTALSASVSIAGDLDAQLAAFTTSLQGDLPITGDLDALIPAITASLVESNDLTGDLAAQIPALVAALQGDVAITGELAAAIPAWLTVLRSGAPGSLAAGLRRRLLLLLQEEDD